jgi:Zn-dependent protease with chaperone function
MHGFVLAGFASIIVAAELGSPFIPGFERTAWTTQLVATATLLALFWIFTAGQIRSLLRFGRMRSVYRIEAATVTVRWMLMLMHLAAVLVFGVFEVPRSILGDTIAIDELITALPFFAAITATEFIVYPLERRLRDAITIRNLDLGRPVHPFPPRWRYTWHWSRHNLLFMLIPLVLLAAWMEASARFIPNTLGGSFVAILVQLLGVALVFALIPPLLVSIWDTVRLGPGALRDRLDQLANYAGVRIRAVLVWRTGGSMLNGAAIGMVYPLRYVVLTDGLLDSLSDEQVEAVAAHELAHMRCRHMLWLGLAVISTVLVAGAPLGWLVTLTPQGTAAEQIALIATLGATLVLVLVALALFSRRFEREADAWATAHVAATRAPTPLGQRVIAPDAAAAMASALDVVAQAQGLPTSRPTLRHGSIAHRQQLLHDAVGRTYATLPAIRAARHARRAAIVLLLLGAALVAVDSTIRQHVESLDHSALVTGNTPDPSATSVAEDP